MLLPFIGTVLVSRYAKNAAFYTLYHQAVLAIVWIIALKTALLSGIFTPWILTAAVIIAYILFFIKRMNRQKSSRYLTTSPMAAIAFLVLWFIDQQRFGSGTGILLITGCLFMLGCLLGQYLENLFSYIDNNQQVANMPVLSIIRSSHGMMTAFMFLGMVFILVFTILVLEILSASWLTC